MLTQQPSHRKYSAFFKSNFSVSHLQTYTKKKKKHSRARKKRKIEVAYHYMEKKTNGEGKPVSDQATDYLGQGGMYISSAW